MSKRALIVIDLQNDYFEGGRWALSGIEQATENAAVALEAARKAGDLVVHVRHEFPSQEAPFFTPGSDGAQIHPRVSPAADETVITKNHVNAFRDTNLHAVLEARGVRQVVVVGAMSHMCIDSATRAASDLGYEVTVLNDACATRDLEFGTTVVPAEQVHAASMSALGFAFAKTVTTQRWLGGDGG